MDRSAALLLRVGAWCARLKIIRWCSGHALLAGALLTSFTVFMNCPYYHRFLFQPEREAVNWPPFFEQAQDPFTDHSHKHPAHMHATKLGFRFVPAVLCNLLQVNTPLRALAFQLIAQFALCTLVFVALRRGAPGAVHALATAVPFCLVAGGHPIWQDEWGFFDTVAIAFLVGAWLVRHNASFLLLLLLAFFTDERAVVASPAVLLAAGSNAATFMGTRSVLTGRALWLIVALALYGLLRTGLGHWLGLRTEPVGPEFMLRQLHLLPYALLHGHEGFFAMTFLAIVVLLRRRLKTAALLTILGTLAVWLCAVWVIDHERSMGYLLPYLIASAITVRSAVAPRHFHLLVASVAVLNLLHSDSLTLPEQLVDHFTGDTPGHMLRTWLLRP